MYGHLKNDYTAHSAFAQANLADFRELGLVDWTADTWTIIPGVDVRYVFSCSRAEFKLSSDFAYYYTQSFEASNPNLTVGGSSETWKNIVEADIPTEIELFGRELRTGGSFSRTEFFGDVRTGLDTGHMYQFHGRLVLDLIGLWKMKWLGLGGSYIWGDNFHAWTFGADVTLKL